MEKTLPQFSKITAYLNKETIAEYLVCAEVQKINPDNTKAEVLDKTLNSL